MSAVSTFSPPLLAKTYDSVVHVIAIKVTDSGWTTFVCINRSGSVENHDADELEFDFRHTPTSSSAESHRGD